MNKTPKNKRSCVTSTVLKVFQTVNLLSIFVPETKGTYFRKQWFVSQEVFNYGHCFTSRARFSANNTASFEVEMKILSESEMFCWKAMSLELLVGNLKEL